MNAEKVDTFIATKQKYLPADKLAIIKQKLESAEDSKSIIVSSIEMKDPTIVLVISLFLGGLGIDRFMIGDSGMGILKLLTCGLCGILTIIDWVIIMEKTKEYNYNRLVAVL